MSVLTRVCAIALSSVAFAGAAQAASDAKTADRMSCFWARQWGGWSSPNPKVIYLHINYSDYYKVGLSSPSNLLRDSTFHLRSINASTDSICTPAT